MLIDTPADLLQLITAAVTPVVMVSVSSVLILGINSKHQSMADRMRTLTSEFRNADTSEPRRNIIAQQLPVFHRRIRYASTAQRLLYLAIVVFLLTVLLIILSNARISWTPAAYALFLLGILIILVAVILECIELYLADHTIRMEVSDVVKH